MERQNHAHTPKEFILFFLKWALLSALLGGLGGVMGAGFHHVLHFVTHLRLEHPWLIFLLPAAGILTVLLYRLLRLKKNRGTNEIIEHALDGKPISPLVTPAIFLATSLTHLFGGSAGREGAALQLGGSTASLLAKLFRQSNSDRRLMIMSGMSAMFAGLFGTPLTASLFILEFEAVGTIFSPALLPCFVAALVASEISGLLGVHPEGMALEQALSLGTGNWGRILILGVLVALLGVLMCHVFHKAEHLAQHGLPNPFLRILVGGTLLLGLTLVVGDHRFNGAGMDMALKAVEGHADWYSFALKLLFTAITLAAGFKGGEIVPTFCIGATFGCVAGGLLGLDPGIAGALGLVGLFCCATNAPVTSVILGVELFGSANLPAFALVCVIGFVLSGNSSLYASQVFRFDRVSVETDAMDADTQEAEESQE